MAQIAGTNQPGKQTPKLTASENHALGSRLLESGMATAQAAADAG